jgi:hypothetical protein
MHISSAPTLETACYLVCLGTQMNARNIAVSRRADVEFLDSFIGPKS